MQLRYCDLREWRKKLVDYSGNSNNIIFFFFARSIFHSDYSFQLVIFVDSFVNKWSIVASCRSNLVLLKMLPKFSFLVMEHRTRLRKLISLIENSFFPPFFFFFFTFDGFTVLFFTRNNRSITIFFSLFFYFFFIFIGGKQNGLYSFCLCTISELLQNWFGPSMLNWASRTTGSQSVELLKFKRFRKIQLLTQTRIGFQYRNKTGKKCIFRWIRSLCITGNEVGREHCR